MTERKAGTVWLEWFPGLKIETWGTRQKLIPEGNDRKKGNSNSKKGNSNSKKSKGKSKGNRGVRPWLGLRW